MGSRSERRAFVIHGLDHARAALSAAATRGAPIALWSAPGAAAYMGAPLFRDIIDTASAEFPDVDAIGVLDCGGDPGHALAALRHGLRYLRVALPPETFAKVAAIAEQAGATVFCERPPAVDLADTAAPFDAGGGASPSCQAQAPRVVGSAKDRDMSENEK